MLRKIGILLFLPIMLDLLVGCCCDCPDEPLEDITLTHCELNTLPLDNSGLEIEPAAQDTVPSSAFGIRLELRLSQDLCVHPNARYRFISSAYAYSCDCYQEDNTMYLDSIISIEVLTLQDFDETHLAGQAIDDYLFTYNHQSYTSFESFASDIHYYGRQEQITRDLLLLTPPESSGHHDFVMNISLNDGRILSDTTSIYLQ